MVSFWPWKGDDNSPASFEKALASLYTRIAEATTRLDQQRSKSRRFKALWTLYSTFAYLFYSIGIALVLGWKSWGFKEYAAISGGPVLIYGVRTLGALFFDYRISRTQRGLNELQKQRDDTIEKLKVATKYNSTQQLLEKYGGESPSKTPSPKPLEKRKLVMPQQPVGRTGLSPPPTANIRRAPSQQFYGLENTPSRSPAYQTPIEPQQQQQPHSLSPHAPSPPISQPQTDEPGFAPNAFPTSAPQEQPNWYDRLLDVLLGEDETQPRNRMAMICHSCRLVNGQAPPGINTLQELGRWRCGGCQAWNGVESETTKLLSSLRHNRSQSQGKDVCTHSPVMDAQSDGPDDGAMVESSDGEQSAERESESEVEAQSDQPEEAKPELRRSKRGKSAQ
ncbi:hypothetical protein N7495_009980 [Penicillium taxi]|uniref:uncharacterized protein n=1 Tax=Penicillium taxi TaxID=168475 RepID=UPI0025455479|nr:uncharacterized protein N7495_009980 [Penicillium taxi]KAJ5885470.1 hypothetical protein N7495_009980 [Penicillium taxi]